MKQNHKLTSRYKVQKQISILPSNVVSYVSDNAHLNLANAKKHVLRLLSLHVTTHLYLARQETSQPSAGRLWPSNNIADIAASHHGMLYKKTNTIEWTNMNE